LDSSSSQGRGSDFTRLSQASFMERLYSSPPPAGAEEARRGAAAGQ
jgi:hypothetical protein